jgi:uncharacterized protein
MSNRSIHPGVYVEEVPGAVRAIQGVPTGIAAFLGRTARGPVNDPVSISGFDDFERTFGGLTREHPLGHAVRGFCRNGGSRAIVVRLHRPGPRSRRSSGGLQLDPASYLGDRSAQTGIFALERADLFNLLCIPPDTRQGSIPAEVYGAALAYCVERRAILIVDPPADWDAAETARSRLVEDIGVDGPEARNAALYFPRVTEPDPLHEDGFDTFAPSGIVAGVIARTDAQKGVWKAPAGLDGVLRGTSGLALDLTDADHGTLNPLGINVLRTFPALGRVIWGARTLRSASQANDEYVYLPVRRLALYLEESLMRGTRWATLEPNGEPLWAQLRVSIDAFLHSLFRQGAFRGDTPRDAYFVRVDQQTTSQADLERGIVRILVGFAPLRPAEFLVLQLEQEAGPSPT